MQHKVFRVIVRNMYNGYDCVVVSSTPLRKTSAKFLQTALTYILFILKLQGTTSTCHGQERRQASEGRAAACMPYIYGIHGLYEGPCPIWHSLIRNPCTSANHLYVRSTHHLVFGGSKLLARVVLRLYSTSLACTGSLGEMRCCNEAVHIRRHIATNKKTEPSNSEVVTALLLQDIQYPLDQRVPQLIGTFRRNVLKEREVTIDYFFE
jgi:hypothetical protein